MPVLLEQVVHWLDAATGHGAGGRHASAAAATPGRWPAGVGPDGTGDRASTEIRPPSTPPSRTVGAVAVAVWCRRTFATLPEVLDQLDIEAVDGVLLDLGLSSDQLADRERGFSFSADGPLDLRFDPTAGEPARRLIGRLSAEHLTELISRYGEERYSRRIAQAIVRERREHPIETSAQLAELIRRSVPRTPGGSRIDPATRTFQALRIAVNEELKSLEIALRRIPERLRPGARMAVISFHSLEDRRVKEAFLGDDRLDVLTRRPIRPDEKEIADNPRSRSAKLRVAQRR